MPETVTKEMVLACAQDLLRDVKELKAEVASLKTEVRAMKKEIALFVQSRLAEGQPDPGK